jgi:hypothetical protein
MTPPRSIPTAGILSMLLLVVPDAGAQDRAPSRSAAASSRSARSATSHYGVPYWQTAAVDARAARSTRDDGVAPRLYERHEEPAPVQAPAPRRNYYSGTRPGQYTSQDLALTSLRPHQCTPSRGQLAGRR